MYYIYGQSGPSLLIESTDSMIYKYKKQLQKIEKKVGMEYQKHTNKGSKDGNKLRSRIISTSFCPQLWLFIYQTLQIVFE